MRSIIGIGLLGMSLLTGCVFWGDTYHKKEVLSFVIDAKDNPGLTTSIWGVVDTNSRTIGLRLPNTVALRSFVVRFEHSGLRASLDGVPFESGSRVDFSKDHTLEIQGVDEAVQVYRFQVKLHAKVFTEFSFSTTQNPLLASSITLGWQALGLTYEDYSASDYGWFAGYGTPTATMQVHLPADTPTTLVPTFSHNTVSVLWKGLPFTSGVTALDVTSDQVLTLVGADGSTQDVAVRFFYQPLSLSGFQLLVKDNPTLRKDCQGTLNTTTKAVSLAVPTYIDATALVVRFDHNGTKVLINGKEAVSGSTKVDLSQGGTLTLAGTGGPPVDYQLLVTAVAPSSSKQLLSRRLYGTVGQTSQSVPSYYDEITGIVETSPAPDVSTLTADSSSNRHLIDPALVYLEFQTTAIRVSAGVQTLTPGLLSNGAYSPANWLDFSKPVVLTLTAEDLSTKTVTLNLVVK